MAVELVVLLDKAELASVVAGQPDTQAMGAILDSMEP
jgi:hypothetical protein